jgi:C4-dicarboxylate-specific signal transduction histidine kinase
MTRTRVRELVDDTLELCSERFRLHNIDLRVGPVSDVLDLDCNSVQISQVLLNLLSNAHDAVEGHDRAWVALDVKPRAGTVELSVTDSNPGVPPEIRSKIFQPFFTTKGVGRGTGLGLAVSHGIIEEHHGRLELDLASAHTRFVVTLPLRQPVVA